VAGSYSKYGIQLEGSTCRVYALPVVRTSATTLVRRTVERRLATKNAVDCQSCAAAHLLSISYCNECTFALCSLCQQRLRTILPCRAQKKTNQKGHLLNSNRASIRVIINMFYCMCSILFYSVLF